MASRPGDAPVVIALGGNTLLGASGPWTLTEQVQAVERTAEEIVATIEAGYEVVLTHGNGPQVGNRVLQQERAEETPQLPLDVLVAETQAQIGYLLQQALDNALAQNTDFMTVVTQTIVDADDPAFENPTKPVGPYYSESEAASKDFETREVGDGTRPHRRVVPSPTPVDIVESEEIQELIERGNLVICAGGGGVPVVQDDGLRGVEAVVDKDRTARLLAAELDAETLVILTDVEYAYVNYGDPAQRALGAVGPAEVRTHLDAGEFATGSMRPKIEAALTFVEGDGERAVITTPENLEAGLDGRAGTRIVPEE